MRDRRTVLSGLLLVMGLAALWFYLGRLPSMGSEVDQQPGSVAPIQAEGMAEPPPLAPFGPPPPFLSGPNQQTPPPTRPPPRMALGTRVELDGTVVHSDNSREAPDAGPALAYELGLPWTYDQPLVSSRSCTGVFTFEGPEREAGLVMVQYQDCTLEVVDRAGYVRYLESLPGRERWNYPPAEPWPLPFCRASTYDGGATQLFVAGPVPDGEVLSRLVVGTRMGPGQHVVYPDGAKEVDGAILDPVSDWLDLLSELPPPPCFGAALGGPLHLIVNEDCSWEVVPMERFVAETRILQASGVSIDDALPRWGGHPHGSPPGPSVLDVGLPAAGVVLLIGSLALFWRRPAAAAKPSTAPRLSERAHTRVRPGRGGGPSQDSTQVSDKRLASATAGQKPRRDRGPSGGEALPDWLDALLRGTLGARYSEYRVLGSGGMGTVVRARDTTLNRLVAVKVPPPQLVGDPAHRARFLREAEALARLSHPNVTAVHDVPSVPDGKVPVMIMEFIGGGDLGDQLKRGGRPPVETALGWIRQAGAGLVHAHEAGVLHRDVKPANLMLTDEGVVKLVDFGLAALEDRPGLTRSGMVMGSLPYMAPEQLAGVGIGPPADQFGLAATAYQLLTGKLPFAEDDLKRAHLCPIRDLRPEIPVTVGEALRRALAVDPGRRFSSMKALVAAL